MINFSSPLHKGTLIKRYKRFLADVELADGGDVITAHCPNTGSMKTCGAPGDTVFLTHNPSPTRKLKYTWELTKTRGGYIGVNTHTPNALVKAAIANGDIKELAGYAEMKTEVKYGKNSRIDVLLSDPRKGDCYVEVKNSTLLDGERVIFPDAVSERGLKHIHELVSMVEAGHKAVLFFLVNRPEGKSFAPADAIHPEYGAALREAKAAGLKILAYRAKHSLKGIRVTERVPVRLGRG